MANFDKLNFIFFVFFHLFFSYVISIGVDIDLSFDRTNWVNPNDPLSDHKPSSLMSSNFHGNDEKNCFNSCEQLVEVLSINI